MQRKESVIYVAIRLMCASSPIMMSTLLLNVLWLFDAVRWGQNAVGVSGADWKRKA